MKSLEARMLVVWLVYKPRRRMLLVSRMWILGMLSKVRLAMRDTPTCADVQWMNEGHLNIPEKMPDILSKIGIDQ